MLAELSDPKYNQACSGPNKCLVKVNADKKIERRCASESDEKDCKPTENCELCDAAFCNKAVYPLNRRRCHQCTGSSCNNVESSAATPCEKYLADDQCYSFGTSDTTMVRGCKSDDAGEKNPCSDDKKDGCSWCSSDNCNNLAYKYDQKLKCVQCSSATDKSSCVADQSSAVDLIKNCQKQIPYDAEAQCYTSAEKGVVERGCLLDKYEKKEDCKTENGCTLCSDKDGCNSKEVKLDFTCIVCRSDENKLCWNDATKLSGSKCRTSPSSVEDGCFHGIFSKLTIAALINLVFMCGFHFRWHCHSWLLCGCR